MGPVHIRICHDHDLVVTKLRDIKVISVSFGKSTSKGIDHGLDLRIGQHLVNGGFLHIQDLSSDGQDGLIVTVLAVLAEPPAESPSTMKISQWEGSFSHSLPAFRWSQRIFLLGQKIGLGSLFCFADLGSFLRTGKDCLQSFQITVKIEYHLFSHNFPVALDASWLSSFVLGLSLESWFRMLDGNNCCHSVTDICTCEIRIFIFQNTNSLA